MDRRFLVTGLPLALVSAGLASAAFAWGVQDELPRGFTFASLGDMFGASGPEPHPEAVVLHLDLDSPDPRVLAFERDYGNVQSEINQKEDMIWATGMRTRGVDPVVLDWLLNGVDKLQEDLDQEYLNYLALANSQGGYVSAEQDSTFRSACRAIRSRIEIELTKANSIANGSSAISAA